MAVSCEYKGMVHGAVHKEAVMAHDDDAAVELRQVFLQDFEGGDVKVVGRLIEDEEIGLGHQYHGQVEPAALATTQFGNELLLVLGREQEVTEPCHGCVVVLLVKVDILSHVAHGINHTFSLVKVHPFLAVVGKFHCFANLKVSAVGLDNVEQQFDECGLAHAVVAHDTQFLVTGECVVEIVKYHLVAEALIDMVGGKDLFTDIGALDVQLHFAIVTSLLCTLLQVIEGIDAVLCLMGSGLWLAAHPVQFGTQQVACSLHLDVLRFNTLGTFLQVVIVVAAIGEDAVLVHLQDAVADVVQEIAVVGHHQQGHTAALQVVLQPLDHVDVEVVGRLVENKHLRLVNQESCQGDALHLATAQLFDGLVIVCNLELSKNLLEAFLIVPCRVGVHRLDSRCHGIAVTGTKGLLIVMDGG